MTKLTFVLAAAGVIFAGPGTWLSASLPGLLAAAILWRAGLARRAGRAMLRLLPLVLALFLVHGLFSPLNETILARAGPFAAGREGLLYAALISIRLASALAASLVLVMSTHPSHLVQALETAGLPRGLAYLLGSPLLLLPQLTGRVLSIRAAQQARGLETQGSFLQRARALYPLAAPLIFSALVDVEERSLALEARGFSAPTPKTHLRELHDTRTQRAARGCMLLAGFVLIGWGVWRRLHGGA